MKKHFFTLLIVAMMQQLLFSMPNLMADGKKYEPCSENKYQGNMILTAQVRCQSDTIFNCEVAVFDSNGECRASELSNPDDNGLVYLTIQGEGQGENLNFRVVYYSVDALEDVLVEETLTFVNDDIVGSFNDPFVINVNQPESVEDMTITNVLDIRPVHNGVTIYSEKRQNVTVYNLLGVCMFQQEVTGERTISLPDGIYVVNGVKIIIK